MAFHAGARPSISLLIVRWRGDIPVENNGDDFSYSNDVIDGILEHISGLLPSLECDITELGVKTAADVATAATKCRDWHCRLHGRHLGAMYFLWPSQPSLAGAVRSKPVAPGYVPAEDLFHLMQAMETYGVKTIFPGPVNVYRDLAGKAWPARLAASSWGPLLGLPATTNIPRAHILKDHLSAARDAELELQRQREAVDDSTIKRERLVLKLPFSWESVDVMAVEGPPCEWSKRLRQLINRGRHQFCLVQDFLHSNLEIRYHILQGSICDVRYTRYRRHCKSCGAFSHFQRLGVDAAPWNQRRQRVIALCFDGDAPRLDALEKRIHGIVRNLLWQMKQDWGHLPAYMRLDFLVETTTDGDSVWTNEIGELGSSMCGWPNGKRLVLSSCLDAFLQSSCCSVEDCACKLEAAWRTRLPLLDLVSDSTVVSCEGLLQQSSACEMCQQEARKSPPTPAEACQECGVRICNACLREGLSQKLAHCDHCGMKLCLSCTQRSREAGKLRITELMKQKSNETGTDLGPSCESLHSRGYIQDILQEEDINVEVHTEGTPFSNELAISQVTVESNVPLVRSVPLAPSRLGEKSHRPQYREEASGICDQALPCIPKGRIRLPKTSSQVTTTIEKLVAMCSDGCFYFARRILYGRSVIVEPCTTQGKESMHNDIQIVVESCTKQGQESRQHNIELDKEHCTKHLRESRQNYSQLDDPIFGA